MQRTKPATREIVVDNVRVRCTPHRYRVNGARHRGQRSEWSKPGTLTVTPLALSIHRRALFDGFELHVTRQDIKGMVESWRPILFSGGRLVFEDRERMYEFRLPRFDDAVDARTLLTTEWR